jgi:S-formylglutathione hydrolase FrmB
MANITVRFYSDCLRRFTTFQMFLPNEARPEASEEEKERKKKKPGVLVFLHGYTGDAGICVPEPLADRYNFAVVAPNGENGFWLDGISTGHQFGTFLGEELPGFIRKTFHLMESPENTCVMGMSMGGFGAIRTALRYPDVYGKGAGMSSALIVHEVAEMKEGQSNPVANYEYYRECFGDTAKVLESDNNPETLVKKLKAGGKKLPEILMSCGTEDFLLEPNRRFHQFLKDEGVEHVYEEDKGGHDMDFWNKYIERFIPRMFGE